MVMQQVLRVTLAKVSPSKPHNTINSFFYRLSSELSVFNEYTCPQYLFASSHTYTHSRLIMLYLSSLLYSLVLVHVIISSLLSFWKRHCRSYQVESFNNFVVSAPLLRLYLHQFCCTIIKRHKNAFKKGFKSFYWWCLIWCDNFSV